MRPPTGDAGEHVRRMRASRRAATDGNTDIRPVSSGCINQFGAGCSLSGLFQIARQVPGQTAICPALAQGRALVSAFSKQSVRRRSARNRLPARCCASNAPSRRSSDQKIAPAVAGTHWPTRRLARFGLNKNRTRWTYRALVPRVNHISLRLMIRPSPSPGSSGWTAGLCFFSRTPGPPRSQG